VCPGLAAPATITPMTRRAFLLVLPLLAGLLVAPARATAPEIPPAEWILDHVKALSAPEMDGRASGTAGGDRAAKHIAQAFQQLGLAPGGDAGGLSQTKLLLPGALAVDGTGRLLFVSDMGNSRVLVFDVGP